MALAPESVRNVTGWSDFIWVKGVGCSLRFALPEAFVKVLVPGLNCSGMGDWHTQGIYGFEMAKNSWISQYDVKEIFTFPTVEE